MGKRKKGHNWKARSNDNNTDHHHDQQNKKIKIDFEYQKDKFDNSNALVLLNDKEKGKKKKEKVKVGKILSKKQRKKLEQIVQRRKKKQDRGSLLESLKEVQATAVECDQLLSTATMKKKSHKSQFQEQEKMVVNSIKGKGKGKRDKKVAAPMYDKKNPNIVGFEESSEEESSDDEDLPEIQNKKEETVVAEESSGESEEESDDESGSEDEDGEEKEEERKEEKTLNGVKCNNDEAEKKQAISNDKEEPKTERPTVHIPIYRSEEVTAARLKLPIMSEEQQIMEAVRDHSVVIIAGETGSGKTTQLPQFLYEAGYASDGRLIGVTEPRRVAAISMSSRVGEEMNLPEEVSYLIRFQGNVTEKTKIKFMTDGVLLKEIQQDFLLSRYSVVIIDEAHERSVYTDILIGLLSRIVPLRAKKGDPLKMLIMSATLRVEDFTSNERLFRNPPPVIKVESRQYPVTIHFNKRTPSDYVAEAYRKVCKIHRTLPSGGILVFLTGQQEVNKVCNKLRKAFPMSGSKQEEEEPEDEMVCLYGKKKKRVVKAEKRNQSKLPQVNLDDYSVMPYDETNLDVDDDNDSDEEGFLPSDDEDDDAETGGREEPLYTLPLYSLLPAHKQAKVFEPCPEGSRLCVVATNVAETSLTIPGVKYVIDCGKVKTRVYDKVTGVSAFSIVWTSQASANQRAGRAGRTAPGHAYRLYSSAVFKDQFQEWSVPEIQRRPVEDLLLQMKAMNIQKVINFPFPSPPDSTQLRTAERRLQILGALKGKNQTPEDLNKDDKNNEQLYTSSITELGKTMAAFPLSPSYSKVLALSTQRPGLLPYALSLTAALAVPELLMEHPPPGSDKDKKKKWLAARKAWAASGESLLLGDAMVLLKAVNAALYSGGNMTVCDHNGLRHKGLKEVRQLRRQLANQLNLVLTDTEVPLEPDLKPPDHTEAKLLRQLLLSGLPDRVAKRDTDGEDKEAYRCSDIDQPVYIHPLSVLKKQKPEYVLYQEIVETSRMYMKGVTCIEPDWLVKFARNLCQLSDPLEDPEPRYDPQADQVYCHCKATYGRSSWDLGSVEVKYPENVDRYRWFARCLLQGEVCTKLQQYTKLLLATPQTMLKAWAKLQPRTTQLLNTLLHHQVTSRQALVELWRNDRSFLLTEYMQWLPEGLHNSCALNWPPVDSEELEKEIEDGT